MPSLKIFQSKVGIIISLCVIFLAIFLSVKSNIFSSKKLDIKIYKSLSSEYSGKASFNFQEEELSLFIFQKEGCMVKALLYGVNILEKLEYKISYNSITMQKKEQNNPRPNEIACIQFGVKIISDVFETTKTKQEFINFTKNLFIEFQKSGKASKKFLDKNFILQSEEGALIISIN
jgi:hypothetical protein